jgi:hypothetical protein
MKKGLLDSLIAETGLPEKDLRVELFKVIQKNKFSPDNLTMDELREIMSEYLNIVFLEIAGKK